MTKTQILKFLSQQGIGLDDCIQNIGERLQDHASNFDGRLPPGHIWVIVGAELEKLQDDIADHQRRLEAQ